MVIYLKISYNNNRFFKPEMCDSTCCFEPTFTLKGILILSDGCQASVCSGRQKSDCGYPPSIARSQNIRPGILGILKKIKHIRQGSCRPVTSFLV